jgi:hypothetical protein
MCCPHRTIENKIFFLSYTRDFSVLWLENWLFYIFDTILNSFMERLVGHISFAIPFVMSMANMDVHNFLSKLPIVVN